MDKGETYSCCRGRVLEEVLTGDPTTTSRPCWSILQPNIKARKLDIVDDLIHVLSPVPAHSVLDDVQQHTGSEMILTSR